VAASSVSLRALSETPPPAPAPPTFPARRPSDHPLWTIEDQGAGRTPARHLPPPPLEFARLDSPPTEHVARIPSNEQYEHSIVNKTGYEA